MHSALQVLGITDHPHADCGMGCVTWKGVLAVWSEIRGWCVEDSVYDA
jgi:hypothetical protein